MEYTAIAGLVYCVEVENQYYEVSTHYVVPITPYPEEMFDDKDYLYLDGGMLTEVIAVSEGGVP